MSRPATLADAVARRTRTTPGGHLRWTGPTTSKGLPRLVHHGVSYTIRDAVWQVRHGRPPTGRLTAYCDHPWCLAHLTHRPPKPAVRPARSIEPGWEAEAACRGPDMVPAWWDARRADTGPGVLAAQVCARCPVAAHCLAVVMRAEGDQAGRDRYGIYAGYTPAGRRALHDQHKRRRRELAA